jgi:fatty-acyl-CoA synthase
MTGPNLTFWPERAPGHLPQPETSLWFNLEVAATRYPRKTAIVFYDSILSYAQLQRSARYLAGFLQHRCGVKCGDRIALFLHNSPQFIIAFYALLRAEAMVVPVNSMSTASELTHIIADCGARILITVQELLLHARSLDGVLQHTIVACYSDYLTAPTDLNVPDFLRAAPQTVAGPATTPWTAALAMQLEPTRMSRLPMIYVSCPTRPARLARPRGASTDTKV